MPPFIATFFYLDIALFCHTSTALLHGFLVVLIILSQFSHPGIGIRVLECITIIIMNKFTQMKKFGWKHCEKRILLLRIGLKSGYTHCIAVLESQHRFKIVTKCLYVDCST
jgi:hypothetical protein